MGDPENAKQLAKARKGETNRLALGTISSNLQHRVQPSRVAKQKEFAPQSNVFQQQAFPSQPPPSFQVYVDETKASAPNQENELHPAVATFVPVFLEPTVHKLESPMLLDESMSTDQENEVPTDPSFVEKSKSEDDFLAPEYQSDIYAYLREAETRNRPKPNYMKKQPDITENMRCILVDWLVEVAEEYRLHRETLCLAVNYVDRFLSHMSVLRGKLQLVGCAAMFLASKYEEIYPPDVGEFVYITDETYTKKQVLRMEHLILKVLSFDVAVPTSNCFAETYLEFIKAGPKMCALSYYLLELSLGKLDPFIQYLPSVTAASAIALASHILGKEHMVKAVEQVSGYSASQLQACSDDLLVCFKKAPSESQQAILEKYKSPNFYQVSMLSVPQDCQISLTDSLMDL